MKARYQKLDSAAYQALIAGAALLEEDTRGPKVFDLPDGRILKLFRIRRRLSSNLWLPYAKRFARNASRLAALGVPTIAVEAWGRVPHLARQFVLYQKLPGTPLRHLPAFDAALLGRSLAELHEQGVLFRSCHLGNWLLTPEGHLALIDVADLHVSRRPLGVWARARNFDHLTRKGREAGLFRECWPALLAAYFERAQLRPTAAQSLRTRVKEGLTHGGFVKL